MKQVFISFLVICCCFSIDFSQTKPTKFVGAYQWCPFPCQTIKLNSDFTFNYLLDGDLFNKERSVGFWHFIEKDRIYLQTIENAPLVKVDERTGKDNPNVKIQVFDLVGATFSNFEIRVNGTKYLTNENGICEIPKTEQFSFSYAKRNYLYHIKNNNLEAIDIMLGEISSAEIEGTFVLRKNEICKIGDNSNDLTCYRKLKKATEIKLFPPYSQ